MLRGVARIFQKGGGGGHTVSNIIVMAFSPRNIVGCLLKKRLTEGGHGHPRTPLATPLYAIHCIAIYSLDRVISRRPSNNLGLNYCGPRHQIWMEDIFPLFGKGSGWPRISDVPQTVVSSQKNILSALCMKSIFRTQGYTATPKFTKYLSSK